MKNAFSKKTALQALLQHFRSQNIGDLLQEVSGAWLALYFHAQFAQPFHPLPHHGPRDANLFSDPRAADHDGGIFRQQREQPCQPPVGCAQ